MFKVGDIIKSEESGHLYEVIQQRAASFDIKRLYTGSVYTDQMLVSYTMATSSDLTEKLLSTYGREYLYNVCLALEGARIKYASQKQEQEVRDIYVGKKNLAKAKKAVDEYYAKLNTAS